MPELTSFGTHSSFNIVLYFKFNWIFDVSALLTINQFNSIWNMS